MSHLGDQYRRDLSGVMDGSLYDPNTYRARVPPDGVAVVVRALGETLAAVEQARDQYHAAWQEAEQRASRLDHQVSSLSRDLERATAEARRANEKLTSADDFIRTLARGSGDDRLRRTKAQREARAFLGWAE